MKNSKRFIRLAAITLFAVGVAATPAARSATTAEDIASGMDPLTLGQVPGNYQGGRVLAGEYFPAGSTSVASARDAEIANGMDPLTLGQVAGNFQGGRILAGEYFPAGARRVASARDADFANGMDPLTLGQVAGNFGGGQVLAGEYLPYDVILTAARR